MVRPRSLPLGVSLLLVAGCLPSRDNPFDSSRRPKAVLEVRDFSTASACASVDSAAPFPTVLVASRGQRCLVLDGSGSSDGQSSLSDLELTLRGPLDFEEVAGPSGRVLLGSSYLLTLPYDEPLVFTLRVDDGSTEPVDATALLQLSNARPFAVAPATRTLRLGGFPWAPGADYLVPFDASASFDADDEADLLYRWTFEWTGRVVQSNVANDPAFLEPIDSTVRTRVRAALEVDDGTDLSPATASAAVAVREANLWMVSSNGVARADALARIDTTYGQVAFVPASDGGAWQVLADVDPSPGPEQLRLRRWPDGVDDVLVLPASQFPGRMAVDPVRRRVWVSLGGRIGAWGIDEQGTGSFVRLLGTDPDPSVDIAQGLGGVVPAADLLTVDSAGNAWVTLAGPVPGDSIVEVIDDSGDIVEITLGPETPSGLEARPGTSEVWMALGPQPIGPVSPAKLLRFVSPSSPPLVIETGHTVVWALTWIDDTFFWLFTDDGLLRMDAEALVASPADFEGAVVLRVPLDAVDVDGATFLGDRGTGGIWLASSNHTTYVTADGRPQESFHPFRAIPSAVDPAGALWYTTFGGPGSLQRRVGLLPSQGIVSERLLPSLLGTVPDQATGGLWVVTNAPRGLLRMAEDGAVLSSVGTAVRAGEVVAFPELFLFEVSPDGRFAWGLDHSSYDTDFRYPLVWLDLRVDPPVIHEVADDVYGADLGLAITLLEPLAPIGFAAGDIPYAWTQLGGEVGLVSPAGFDPYFTFPALEVDQAEVRGARSLATNALCLVSVSNVSPFGTEEARARRLELEDSGGMLSVSEQALGTEPAFDLSTHGLTGAYMSPGLAGETCWGIFPRDDRTSVALRGWPSDGTAVLAASVNGSGIGNDYPSYATIVSPARDTAWLTYESNPNALPKAPKLTRMVFDTATGAQIARDDFEGFGFLSTD